MHAVIMEKIRIFMVVGHKYIEHMPISELDNNSDSVWVKVFVNNSSHHYIASWYWQPNGTSEVFQLFRDQLEQIRNTYKGLKTPIGSCPRRFQLQRY